MSATDIFLAITIGLSILVIVWGVFVGIMVDKSRREFEKFSKESDRQYEEFKKNARSRFEAFKQEKRK